MSSPIQPPLDNFSSLRETSQYKDAFSALNSKKYIKLDDKRDLLEYFLASQASSVFPRCDNLDLADQLITMIKTTSHANVKNTWNQTFCSD